MLKEVKGNTAQPEKNKEAASQAIPNNDFIFCGTSPWQPPWQHRHPSRKPQEMEKPFPLLASAPRSWQGHCRSPESSSPQSPSGTAQVTWNRGFQWCHGTELWLHDPKRGQRQQYCSLMPTAQERVSLQIWLGGWTVCCWFGPRLLWLSLYRWQTPGPEVLQMRNNHVTNLKRPSVSYMWRLKMDNPPLSKVLSSSVTSCHCFSRFMNHSSPIQFYLNPTLFKSFLGYRNCLSWQHSYSSLPTLS